MFLVACTRLYNPLCPLVGRSVGLSHFAFFFMILFLGPHCSCPRCLVTSDMAPAHPHPTSVAVYPALLSFMSASLFFRVCLCIHLYLSLSPYVSISVSLYICISLSLFLSFSVCFSLCHSPSMSLPVSMSLCHYL